MALERARISRGTTWRRNIGICILLGCCYSWEIYIWRLYIVREISGKFLFGVDLVAIAMCDEIGDKIGGGRGDGQVI